MLAGVFRDTLRSLRSWRRTPGSALLVVFALGLSGGALITLVSLINALFWRALPVPRPDELVAVSGADARIPGDSPVIPASLFAWLDGAQSVFQGFAGFERFESSAVIENTGQRLEIDAVSGRYFETLGVVPAFGRLVGARDVESVAPVATIGFRCWQTSFASDPNVIGQTLRLRGVAVTVVGVAPREFAGLEVGVPADVWVPASLAPRLLNVPTSLSFVTAFGRLRAGITLPDARNQIESLWPRARAAAAAVVATAVPEGRDEILALQPRIESAARGYSTSGYRSFLRRTLVLLVLSSAITVALSCANLSGLLLARWSTRAVDLAVQAALGASRARLVLQVIGESLGLSMVAVALSAPLALWSARGLTLLLWNNPDASSPLDLSPDYRVLGVMVGLASLVGVCVSLLPAARLWSSNLSLVRGTRGLPGRSTTRSGRWLVAAQVALSVPLLVTAWIVAANLHRLERVNTGFRPESVIVATLTTQSGIEPAADPDAYLTQLASSLRAVPGVAAAALSSSEPVSFSDDRRRRPIVADDGPRGANPFVVAVSPGYFETLTVPFVAGRDFAWTDRGGERDVAIISEELGRALFPGADPLGRRIRLTGRPDRVLQPDRLLEVIGVVADAKLAEPHASNQLILFTALLQQPARSLEFGTPLLLLKSPLQPRVVEAAARRAIVALGRDDIFEVHSLERTRDSALLRERAMRLGAFYFAGLTTLLVFVGLQAVLNLGIARRVPEIGLRIALGASTNDIRMMVMREALATATAGLVVGVPCALLAGSVIASALTLVGPHDVRAFAAAIALILIVAVLSVLTPLRRASRIAPAEALGGQ